jgi:hypothetical protein
MDVTDEGHARVRDAHLKMLVMTYHDAGAVVVHCSCGLAFVGEGRDEAVLRWAAHARSVTPGSRRTGA